MPPPQTPPFSLHRRRQGQHLLSVQLHSLNLWLPLPCPWIISPGQRVCMLNRFSCVQLLATLWTAACQAPLSMGFSREKHWSGWPCPPSGGLPDPGIEPMSLMSLALAGGFFTTSATWEAPSEACHLKVRPRGHGGSLPGPSSLWHLTFLPTFSSLELPFLAILVTPLKPWFPVPLLWCSFLISL